MPTRNPEPSDDLGLGPVRFLRGVGPKQAEVLERLGILTVEDLIRHYPARWVDRRMLRTLGSFGPADAMATELGEDGRSRKAVHTTSGTVVSVRKAGPPSRGRRGPPQRLEIVIRDATGTAGLVFFGGSWRSTHVQEGDVLLVSGPLGMYRGQAQFQSPEYEVLDDEEASGLHIGRLFPVYPLTKGLTQRKMRDWVRLALAFLPGLPETLPPEFQQRVGVCGLHEALRTIHFPESPEARDRARDRLVFEELFLDQLFVSGVRARREEGKRATPLLPGGTAFRRVKASLPFTLTADQEIALTEIFDDLGTGRPMNRMLQGDVGSGKTVVAFLAAVAAADAGVQTAFMVPTEILAEQHHRTLRALGGSFDLEPRLLTGSLSAPARREILNGLATGMSPLVVGTHALFSEDVRFANLGLVVVDEQHRFGVMQRVALVEKGTAPHVLVMTATPIPRTLAMVQFADLDLSIIASRPAGRGKIVTRVTPESKRTAVYGYLADRLREGRQAYIIYPLVEASEVSDLAAVTVMAEKLQEDPALGEFRIQVLHGQMHSDEKDAAMRAFANGNVDILVATTVVEVGIDVPNASFLIIEHPERYGLSQLHQLRGRIGRGEHASYCVLIRQENLDPSALERLELFARTDDGFELARHDLTLRGQGDVLGTRQSGRPAYRLADIWRDREWVALARDEARDLFALGTLMGTVPPAWVPLHARLRRMLQETGSLLETG